MENLTLEQQQELLANINKGIIGTRNDGTWNHIVNTDWKNKNKNTDYEARNAKINWKEARAKGVANTDWEARTAKRDYKASNSKGAAKKDYKAIAAKKDWEAYKKKKYKPVSQFDKQGNFIRDWDSALQAEQELNLSNGGIGSCCRGRLKTAFGFIWKFKQEQN